MSQAIENPQISRNNNPTEEDQLQSPKSHAKADGAQVEIELSEKSSTQNSQTQKTNSALEELEFTPEEQKALKRQGLRVVLGAFMIHLVLGTFYLWGNISLYCASYFKQYDDSITINFVKGVFPFMNIAMSLTLSIGVKIAERFGYKKTCIAGIATIVVSVFISSFMTNFGGFIFFYSVVFGLASGILYLVPICAGWKYFPQYKGRISGTVLAGYGFGSLMFNFISIALANPDNEKASVVFSDGKYFHSDVYDNVPYMFRMLSLFYLIIGTIGCILIRTPDKSILERREKIEALKAANSTTPAKVFPTFNRGAKTIEFPALFIMMILGCFFGLLMVNNYKVYGLLHINDDYFMTIVGAIGGASNGCSRIMWASLFDKYGFRKIYAIVLGFQIILSATLSKVSDYKASYLIWYALIMGLEGGQLAMIPSVSGKIFGPKTGPLLYGIIFFGFSLSNLLAYLLTQVTKDLTWDTLFWLSFAFSIVTFLMNFLINEKRKFN